MTHAGESVPEPDGPADGIAVSNIDAADASALRAAANASRTLPYFLGGSALFHLAVAALLLLSPAGQSLATKLAGLKAEGTSSFGNASQERPTGASGSRQPDAVSVTLTPPPPPARPLPHPQARQASRPAKRELQAEADLKAKARRGTKAVLAARGPAPDAAAPPAEAAEPPAAHTGAASPQAATPPAAAVPAPTPRPRHVASAEPQSRRNEETGALFGRLGGHSDRGSVGGEQAGTQKGEGDAALSNYPGEISRKLDKSLRYPEAAARRGLSGQVRVQFVVEASGKVAEVRVAASSGSDVLDQAAVDTVHRAAPFPSIPAAAGRTDWPFTVTLAFGK